MNNKITTPLVSVIIPTFNRANLIDRAIESVVQQTYTNFEILVVDDASTDNSAEVVNSIGDSRIRYLECEQNAGAAAARNRGINAASGELVAFIDSDDIWMPSKLELQVSTICQCDNWENVVGYTQVLMDNGNTKKLMPLRAKRDNEPVSDYVLMDEGLIHTSTLMLARRLAESRLFPVHQQVHEDWDLFLRLEKRGVIWCFIDQPLSVWHNDPRQGRLANLSYDLSMGWLKDHEILLSSRAIRGFMFKEVAAPLIGSGQRRAYAICLVLGAIVYGAVPPGKGGREILRASVPKRLRLFAKNILKKTVRHGC